jgi:hypothetical protein
MFAFLIIRSGPPVSTLVRRDRYDWLVLFCPGVAGLWNLLFRSDYPAITLTAFEYRSAVSVSPFLTLVCGNTPRA